MFNRPIFAKPRMIVSQQLASTSASGSRILVASSDVPSTSLLSMNGYTVVGENFPVTIVATTGVVWVSFTTAATTNGFMLDEGSALDVMVPNQVSVVSDSTTAKVQGIIWEL